MKLESCSFRPYLFLLCVWCSVHNGPIVGVNGQSVILIKLFLSDPVEGGMMQLKCDGHQLQHGNVLEWSRTVMNQDVRIGRNGVSLNATKYGITLLQAQTPRSELLTIYNLNKYDSGDYFCRIRRSDSDSADILGVASSFFLVFYFPAAIYPICFPDGSFTAQNGTTQNMTCTTEQGNPTARVQIQASRGIYSWQTSTWNTLIRESMGLKLDTTINGISFECKIGSDAFPGMERSCTIGPITVSTSSGPFTPMPTTARVSHITDDFATENSPPNPVGQITLQSDAPRSTQLSTVPNTMTDLRQSTNPQPTTANRRQTTDSQSTFADDSVTIDMTDESNLDRYTLTPRCHLAPQTPDAVPWIIAGVSLSLLLLSLIIIIFLVFNQRRLKNLIQQGIQTHKADPYMELQPKDDKNKEYMGLDVEATSNEQHTYYQAVESMSKSQPHDSEKVSRKPTTEYEVVGLSM